MIVDEVDSPLIKTVGYCKSTRYLVVELKNGPNLVYSNVSDAAYGAFMSSKHQNIDHHYKKYIAGVYLVREDTKDVD